MLLLYLQSQQISSDSSVKINAKLPVVVNTGSERSSPWYINTTMKRKIEGKILLPLLFGLGGLAFWILLNVIFGPVL